MKITIFWTHHLVASIFGSLFFIRIEESQIQGLQIKHVFTGNGRDESTRQSDESRPSRKFEGVAPWFIGGFFENAKGNFETFPDTQWGWPIYLQNWVVLGVNVGKYTIHWASGNGNLGYSGIHVQVIMVYTCLYRMFPGKKSPQLLVEFSGEKGSQVGGKL